jgi:Arc/MetJ-type ribon-helix-helix transcriptional regulator
MNPTDISLTPDNREFLEAKLAAGEFTSESVVVANENLGELIREGIESSAGVVMDDAWWERRTTELQREAEQRRTASRTSTSAPARQA